MQEGASKIGEDLVPGAEKCDPVYLDDLTTAGTLCTGHTNLTDWAGLHAQGTVNPRDVPGLQIDGYFPDDSLTYKASQYADRRELVPGFPYPYYYDPGNPYGNKRYPHDAQFVIRFPNPDLWNGKLVITGSPGVRGQYANDFTIGDFVLGKGYAYAATDKGNSGTQFSRAEFYPDGKKPGAAVAEWHKRVKELTLAAKEAAEKFYGEPPSRTYVTGVSNGGYLTRYALENNGDLYDGGVDWEGPLWTAPPDDPNTDPNSEGPNLLTFLPAAIRNFFTISTIDWYTKHQFMDEGQRTEALKKMQEAGASIAEAGFALETAFLWPYHYGVYWQLTQRIYRQEFDPDYEGLEENYNYAERIDPKKTPQAQRIRKAVRDVSLTGDIEKPLITLHGTLDTLLPITKDSDKYRELIEEKERSHLHRYYKIEGGTHVDALYDHAGFSEKLRPILPSYRAAFRALEDWVERGIEPPHSQTVPKPAPKDVDVNKCVALGYDGRSQTSLHK